MTLATEVAPQATYASLDTQKAIRGFVVTSNGKPHNYQVRDFYFKSRISDILDEQEYESLVYMLCAEYMSLTNEIITSDNIGLGQQLEMEKVLRRRAESELEKYKHRETRIRRLCMMADGLEQRYPDLQFSHMDYDLGDGIPYMTFPQLAESGVTGYRVPNFYSLSQRPEISPYTYLIGNHIVFSPRAVLRILRHQRRTGRAGVGAGVTRSGRPRKNPHPRLRNPQPVILSESR